MTRKSRLRQFEEYAQIWQKKLGLLDWDVSHEYANLLGDLAQVDTDTEAKKAEMWLNKKKSDAEDLEETALHEDLHILLSPLIDLLEKYYSIDYIRGIEHGIINKLSTAFMEKK